MHRWICGRIGNVLSSSSQERRSHPFFATPVAAQALGRRAEASPQFIINFVDAAGSGA
jgi:hypothetical protein